MVYCWTHLRPRQWYSEPHPDWEVSTSLEVSRWLTPSFSSQIKSSFLASSLTKHLTMDRHVSSIVSSCNFHMRALRHIRLRLTLDAAKSVAVSIVDARLDYCNSLLHGTSQLAAQPRSSSSCPELACSAVTQASHRTNATELRRQLHWLPIRILLAASALSN